MVVPLRRSRPVAGRLVPSDDSEARSRWDAMGLPRPGPLDWCGFELHSDRRLKPRRQATRPVTRSTAPMAVRTQTPAVEVFAMPTEASRAHVGSLSARLLFQRLPFAHRDRHDPYV